MNYYEILGIKSDADSKEIKRAYRELSKIHHPDVPTGDEKLFTKISEAYRILSDPQERAAYDNQNKETRKTEFNSRKDSGTYSNLFKTRGKEEPRKGLDIKSNITISFKESIEGGPKVITVRIPVDCEECKGTGKNPQADISVCPDCNGSKRIVTKTVNMFGDSVPGTRVCPTCRDWKDQDATCKHCSGKGIIISPVEVNIQIPAGVVSGHVITLKGLGHKSTNGGPNGDLHLTATVEESDLFERVGRHLFYTLDVKFRQLVLGDEVDVPTPDGTHKLRIPKGTSIYKEFILEGLGGASNASQRRGNLYIKLNLVTPTGLTEEEELVLSELDI